MIGGRYPFGHLRKAAGCFQCRWGRLVGQEAVSSSYFLNLTPSEVFPDSTSIPGTKKYFGRGKIVEIQGTGIAKSTESLESAVDDPAASRQPQHEPSVPRRIDVSFLTSGCRVAVLDERIKGRHFHQGQVLPQSSGSPEAAQKTAVHLTVDGREIVTEEGRTVLQACRDNNIYIPTLCYHPSLKPVGTCRLCLVDTGGNRLEPACTKEVKEGQKIYTHTPEIQDTIRGNLALLRLKHPNACMTCSANGHCELQDLVHRYKVADPPYLHKRPRVKPEVEAQGIAHQHDESSPALSFDFDKCILCLRCVRACSELQGMNVLGATSRGESETVAPLFALPISETACLSCGACVAVCPVAAITEKPHIDQVMELLEEARETGPIQRKGDELIPLDEGEPRLLWGPQHEIPATPTGQRPVLVVQTAPAVRVTISEAFGMAPGAISTGQLVMALKQLGFDYVFDTNFTADLTIMEEATELLHRLAKGGPFPMYTSCCPGWINMVEKTYPELIPNLSSCKSPQQMLGAVAKSYFASAIGRHPSEVKVISIMPCVAKKDEASREEMWNKEANAPDIDYVLTTRELATLIDMHRPKIRFASLQEGAYDSPIGESSGAGLLFGVTGGVMEAALRTAYVVTAPAGTPPLPKLKFEEVRGLQGVRSATVNLHGTELNIALANGGANLRRLVDAIQSGKAGPFHFVEMMACRGGCIGGAGNPKDAIDEKLLQHRAAAIYKGDETATLRMSHLNKEVKTLYDKFLGAPNSEKAEELLHTSYKKREVMQTGIYFPDVFEGLESKSKAD